MLGLLQLKRRLFIDNKRGANASARDVLPTPPHGHENAGTTTFTGQYFHHVRTSASRPVVACLVCGGALRICKTVNVIYERWVYLLITVCILELSYYFFFFFFFIKNE